MPQVPVLNWVQTWNGFTLYPDLIDSTSLYYSPRTSWGALDVDVAGAIAKVSGEIALDISPGDRQVLQQKFPGMKLAPLIPRLVSGVASLSLQIPQPHSVNITSLNSFPYPRLLLNGFLQSTQANYPALVKALRDGWASHTLVVGPIRLDFAGVDAGAAYQIALDYRKIHDDLIATLGPDTNPLSRVTAVVSSYAEQAFDTYAKPLNAAVAGAQKDKVVALVSQDLWNAFVYKADAFFTFDSGRTVDGYLIRESREIGVGSSYSLTKSSGQELAMDFLT